jgi:hypothetical protein
VVDVTDGADVNVRLISGNCSLAILFSTPYQVALVPVYSSFPISKKMCLVLVLILISNCNTESGNWPVRALERA